VVGKPLQHAFDASAVRIVTRDSWPGNSGPRYQTRSSATASQQQVKAYHLIAMLLTIFAEFFAREVLTTLPLFRLLDSFFQPVPYGEENH